MTPTFMFSGMFGNYWGAEKWKSHNFVQYALYMNYFLTFGNK